MIFKAHDPRNSFPAIDKYALTERLSNLDSKRICFMQCIPPYDLSKEMDAVKGEILDQYPSCNIEYFNRRDFMIDDPTEREAIPERADAAILFVGPTATSVHVHWKYAIGLEKMGLPVSMVIPHALEKGVQHEETVRGTLIRWVLAPSYGAGNEEMKVMARGAYNALVDSLQPKELAEGVHHPPEVLKYVCEGTTEEIQKCFLNENLTDGLPIIVPTDAQVEAMLSGTSRKPNEIVCPNLRPEGLETTVEKVAINAVMAGAHSSHFPFILAATSLYGNIQLESMTRSLNGFAFTHFVNGPLGQKINIESGNNALGSANYANETIGRAIQLVLKNCGHQHFGINSNPVMGSPMGIGVVAENEKDSPWKPLHTSLGYEGDDNVISLFVGGHSVKGNYNFGGLEEVITDMKLLLNKSGVLLLISARRAQEWAEKGLTKETIIEKLWSETKTTIKAFKKEKLFMLYKALIERGGDKPPWPKDYLTRPGEDVVPLFSKPGIHVGVVGSVLASIMQLWSSIYLASASVDDWT